MGFQASMLGKLRVLRGFSFFSSIEAVGGQGLSVRA